MSTLAVKVEKIRDVQPHPNADRLDIVQVLDWYCITGRGTFKPGDLCVYIPIDSILPRALEDDLFPPGSKVTLSKSRVKTIKLRGSVSQGMALSLESVSKFLPSSWQTYLEGDDLTKALGITKHEPAEPFSGVIGARKATRKEVNPYFHKYTNIENAKNHPGVFTDGEQVVVTEKIHGTNFRAGWVPFVPATIWDKIKAFFGLRPEWQFVYGSHNVQLQHGTNPFYYESNVYAEAVKYFDLVNRIPKGTVIYGEVYGEGIQKGYTYGCGPGLRLLAVFDVQQSGKYLDYNECVQVCQCAGLPYLAPLYVGAYDAETLQGLVGGPSVRHPQQPIREGIVVKPLKESTHPRLGRKVLKYINPDYLLKADTTEHH